jgi:hypothetical protein
MSVIEILAKAQLRQIFQKKLSAPLASAPPPTSLNDRASGFILPPYSNSTLPILPAASRASTIIARHDKCCCLCAY